MGYGRSLCVRFRGVSTSTPPEPYLPPWQGREWDVAIDLVYVVALALNVGFTTYWAIKGEALRSAISAVAVTLMVGMRLISHV